MKLELVASPAELQGESVETLRAKITEAALDVARAALVDGLRKAQERAGTPAEPHGRVRGSALHKAHEHKCGDALHKAHEHEHECGDALHKARGHRGGEVDLVTEMAGRLEHLYKMRVLALERDLEALKP